MYLSLNDNIQIYILWKKHVEMMFELFSVHFRMALIFTDFAAGFWPLSCVVCESCENQKFEKKKCSHGRPKL